MSLAGDVDLALHELRTRGPRSSGGPGVPETEIKNLQRGNDPKVKRMCTAGSAVRTQNCRPPNGRRGDVASPLMEFVRPFVKLNADYHLLPCRRQRARCPRADDTQTKRTSRSCTAGYRSYYQTVVTPSGVTWCGAPRNLLLRVDARY
jgi:hypothetical protein